MSLIRFDSADAYLAAAAPLIAHDAARSVGLRAWIEGTKQASATERAFMAIWRSGEAVGVAYQRGEQPVLIGDSATRLLASLSRMRSPTSTRSSTASSASCGRAKRSRIDGGIAPAGRTGCGTTCASRASTS